MKNSIFFKSKTKHGDEQTQLNKPFALYHFRTHMMDLSAPEFRLRNSGLGDYGMWRAEAYYQYDLKEMRFVRVCCEICVATLPSTFYYIFSQKKIERTNLIHPDANFVSRFQIQKQVR